MMRHMMFGHAMAGGFFGFMLMRMLRGLIFKLFLLAAVGAAVYFYLQWQKERARNQRPPDLPPGWR
jgi:uncharacterized membrane protein YfcA